MLTTTGDSKLVVLSTVLSVTSNAKSLRCAVRDQIHTQIAHYCARISEHNITHMTTQSVSRFPAWELAHRFSPQTLHSGLTVRTSGRLLLIALLPAFRVEAASGVED